MHTAPLPPPISSPQAKLFQPLLLCSCTTHNPTNHSAALLRSLPNADQCFWGLNHCSPRSVLVPDNPHGTNSQHPFTQAQYLNWALGAYFQDEFNLFLWWLGFIDYFSSFFLISYFLLWALEFFRYVKCIFAMLRNTPVPHHCPDDPM